MTTSSQGSGKWASYFNTPATTPSTPGSNFASFVTAAPTQDANATEFRQCLESVSQLLLNRLNPTQATPTVPQTGIDQLISMLSQGLSGPTPTSEAQQTSDDFCSGWRRRRDAWDRTSVPAEFGKAFDEVIQHTRFAQEEVDTWLGPDSADEGLLPSKLDRAFHRAFTADGAASLATNPNDDLSKAAQRLKEVATSAGKATQEIVNYYSPALQPEARASLVARCNQDLSIATRSSRLVREAATQRDSLFSNPSQNDGQATPLNTQPHTPVPISYLLSQLGLAGSSAAPQRPWYS